VPRAAQHRGERLALDELHREVPVALVLADVEGARDVRVRHPSGELDLAAEQLDDAL